MHITRPPCRRAPTARAVRFGDRRLYVLIALTFLFSGSGCAQRINWSDPQAISSHVRVVNDPYKKVTSYTGPNCAQDPLNDNVNLRAWHSSAGEWTYQIYVDDEYSYEIVRGGTGWRLYSAFHDLDGNNLPIMKISSALNWCGRNVCSYQETLGITVARTYLEDRKDRGLQFKISGRGGEETFYIPAAYVQAFLSIAR